MAVQIFANNVFTTLQGAIVAGDTAITVPASDAEKFPSPSAGDWFLATIEDNVNIEIVKCTDRTGSVLTVVRNQEGTGAYAFPNGSRFDMRVTAGALANFLQPPALTNYVLGPLIATDNALVRYDGPTGKLIKDSLATLDDAGNLAVVGFSTSGAVTLSPASANVTMSPTGTGTVTINPAVAGAIDRMNIGATVAGTGDFTELTIDGVGVATVAQVVRYDAVQVLTGPQQTQARTNIGAENAANLTAGQLAAARLPDGAVVDSVVGTYVTNANLTTLIPLDDTIPTSSEGTQVLSVAISPKTTTNKLRCRFSGQASGPGTPTNIVAAMFQGSTCIDAMFASPQASNESVSMVLEAEYTPGVTSSQTISVRVGPSGAGTVRMNGLTGSRTFGGASNATLVVEEIKA